MKKTFKEGLIFGIGMAVFFVIQNIWNAEHITTTVITKSVVAGIIGGAIAGLVYGFIMNKLQLKNTKQSDQTNKSTV